jgi:hypothetical protein
MPIPRRDISASLLSFEDPKPRVGLVGIGAAILVSSEATADLIELAAAGVVSSSGLYPSLAIRSASSLAFFSASSKSRATSDVIFFAPSLVFFAPRMFGLRAPAADEVVLRIAAEEVVRIAGAEEAGVAAESVAVRGDFGRAVPFPLALGARKGEAVLLAAEGVPVLEGGLLGLLIVGLSHEEKKSSSSGSPAGVCEPEPADSSTSVIWTSPGYLCYVSNCSQQRQCLTSHSFWSAATLLASSSLYLVAAVDVYFVFGSLLLSAAEPPCV